jgi:hypothetical protein
MASYSGFSMIFPLKMVIFHSYVSLPEGIYNIIRRNNQQIQQICVTRNHQTQEPFSTRQTATRRSAGNPIYPQLPNTELLIPREMPTKKKSGEMAIW